MFVCALIQIKAIKEYKIYFDNTYEIIDSNTPLKTQPSTPTKDRNKKSEMFTCEETGLKLNKFPPKPSFITSVATPNYDPKIIYTDDALARRAEEPVLITDKEGIKPAPYTFEDSYKDIFGIDSL